MSTTAGEAYPYSNADSIYEFNDHEIIRDEWEDINSLDCVIEDVVARSHLDSLERKSSRRLKRYLASLSITLSGSIAGSLLYSHAMHERADELAAMGTDTQTFHFDPANKQLVKINNALSGPTLPNEEVNALKQSSFINNAYKEFSTHPAWLQNFNNMPTGPIDYKDWNFTIGNGANGQLQTYTDSTKNVRIENGALTIEANANKVFARTSNYSYESGQINTQGIENFKYGLITVDAIMPKGAGTWPAVWLLPANSKYENLSPVSDRLRYLNGGEIDMIEETGADPNIENAVVHRRADFLNPKHIGAYNRVKVPTGNEKYNSYSLLWTPTKISMDVNNVPFFSYAKAPGANYESWPFNQPFYLIISLAVGGSYASSDKAIYPPYGVDNASLPAAMQVKSIAYYPYIGDTANKKHFNQGTQ